MDVNIRKVENKKDLMEFIKFPWEIYKNDRHWVPPIIMDRKKILDKNKNPFFKHAEAEYFLAERDGKLLGRIAAIKNDMHLKYHDDDTGFFGFFECINDQDVADALFDTAKEWIQQKGLGNMRGPANPSSNDEWGMLIDGLDDSPRLLMTYNPMYYNELCENFGMQKAKDMFAWKIEYSKITKSEKLKRGQEVVRKRFNMKVRELNMKSFDEDLEKFKYVYNKAWAPNWGFVPLTEEEIDAMAKDLKMLIEPSLVIFGEVNGKLVGAALVMQDYNQVFKNMNGRLFPFNFLKLFTQKKKIKWVRILTLGIIPEFQKKGLDTVLYWEVLERGDKLGIHLGEASWVLEDNEMMNRGLDLMKGIPYKKYRLWEISTK